MAVDLTLIVILSTLDRGLDGKTSRVNQELVHRFGTRLQLSICLVCHGSFVLLFPG